MRPSITTTAPVSVPLTFAQAHSAYLSGVRRFGSCLFVKLKHGYGLYGNGPDRSCLIYQPKGPVKVKVKPSVEYPDGVQFTIEMPLENVPAKLWTDATVNALRWRRRKGGTH